MLLEIVKDMYCRFRDDDVPALGAQVTYYLILSFFPFLIFLIAIVSITPLTAEEAIGGLSKLLPENIMSLVEEVIRQARLSNRATFLSFSMLATLWASSNGTTAVIRAINKAYEQEENRPFWKVRGIAVLFTTALALLLLASAGLLVFGELFGSVSFSRYGLGDYFLSAWNFVRFIAPSLIMLLVFTALYLYTPNKRLRLKEAVPGAFFATGGWIIVSFVFSLYVRFFGNITTTYGSLGGIILLLLWLYWSSVILLLGGELNASLAFRKAGIKKPRGKKYC